MVVHQDHGGGVGLDRVAEQVARLDHRGAEAACAERADPDQAVAAVKQYDTQLFAGQVGHLGLQKAQHVQRLADAFALRAAAVAADPTAQFDRCLKLERLDPPDAGQFGQFRDRGVGQETERRRLAACVGVKADQALGQAERGLVARAAADDHGH